MKSIYERCGGAIAPLFVIALIFVLAQQQSAPKAQQLTEFNVANAQTKPSKNKPKVVYACPMHPNVTSTKPGYCPKCHMELKPVDPTATPTPSPSPSPSPTPATDYTD